MATPAKAVIPFDSGKSYVVRSFDVCRHPDQLIDDLGRTEQDREYLEQFDKLFRASCAGDLFVCSSIVNGGFRDFDAVTYGGRYGTPDGKSLDRISPIQVAEMHGHQNIANYFRSVQKNQPSTTAPDLGGRVDVI